VATATFARDRGAILVGQHTAIAISQKTGDQYKYQRVYSKPYMYAPITGWYTFGNETGLEQSQNSFLSGEDDRLFVNRLVDLVNGTSTKGGNVLLTINPAAQKAAFDGLSALGAGVEGAAVAIEPSTGKILAMVSLPSYDPNQLASHNFKKVAAYATRLSKEKSAPLLNRATQTTLPPGSTFKVVTASAALEDKIFSPDALIDTHPGVIKLAGRPAITEDAHHDYGVLSLTDVLVKSSNIGAIKIGFRIGADRLTRFVGLYGFGHQVSPDLGGLSVATAYCTVGSAWISVPASLG